jgi:hypothetical protein
MGRNKHGSYKKLRKRAKELKMQGYKRSGLWNKLAIEFPQWAPSTICQICNKKGGYQDE